MAEIERELWSSSIPTFLLKKGHQDHVYIAFEEEKEINKISFSLGSLQYVNVSPTRIG